MAMVVTRESFMKFGWSSLAWMNLERRSGCLGVRGSVERRMLLGVLDFFNEGNRSAIRALANRATGKVASTRPCWAKRR